MTRPDHGEVARRAYELFLARGAGDGSALQDWLQAERELMATTQRSGTRTRAKRSAR